MLKCLPAGVIVFGVWERENTVTGMAPFPSGNKHVVISRVLGIHDRPKILCMQVTYDRA